MLWMQARPPAREQTIAGREEHGELAQADRLDHLDRRDLRVAAAMQPVVLLDDLDQMLEARRANPFARQLRLGGRDRQAGHAGAVLARRREGERAPAAADLEQVVVRAEVELLADAAELAALRVGERLVGLVEDGARVRHRLVEHQLEEIVAEVVVVPNVPAGAQQPLPAARARPRVHQPGQARPPSDCRIGVPEQQLHQPGQVVGSATRRPGTTRRARACRAGRASGRGCR